MKLTSARLTFHPISINRLESFHSLLTHPFIRKYLCDDQVFTIGQSRDFILESQKTFEEKRFGLWLIHNAEQNVIGFAGLKFFFEEPQPQLLYGLLPEYLGKGLATEAVQTIMKYCFDELKFKYLEASCDAPNLSSLRVAERAGMKKVDKKIVEGKSMVFYRVENE